MLNTLWNFIKLNFNKRLVLYEIGVSSFVLSGIFPNSLVSSFCLFICLTTYMLLTPFLASTFTFQLRSLFAKKYEADQNIRKEVSEVADQLGAKVEKVYIVKGLCNAYVRFHTLYIGEELLNRLNYYTRKAVFAHELGHIKERHLWFKIPATVVPMVLPLWSWRSLQWPIIINELFTQLMLVILIEIVLLTYLIVFNIPINWYLEMRADRLAVQIAGKAATISALLAIVRKEKIKTPSEDHPAISERIKQILKYKPKV